MQLKKTQFSLLLVLLSGMSLQAMVEDGQEWPTREKIRTILIGPVMGFGVAVTTAYCAKKMGWGSSPLAMLGCLVVYYGLHRTLARKGERYNKWHVIPAIIVGYGCGYYIGCPRAVSSIAERLVAREGVADLSQDSNLRTVTLWSLTDAAFTVHVPQDATWADVKQALVDTYRIDGSQDDSLNANMLKIIGCGKIVPDMGKVFTPAKDEFNYNQAERTHLVFKRPSAAKS